MGFRPMVLGLFQVLLISQSINYQLTPPQDVVLSGDRTEGAEAAHVTGITKLNEIYSLFKVLSDGVISTGLYCA